MRTAEIKENRTKKVVFDSGATSERHLSGLHSKCRAEACPRKEDAMKTTLLVSISLALSLLLALVPVTYAGDTPSTYEVTVPNGTKVYCELDQRVESKTRGFQLGDKVQVRVWRDVVVNGEIVIPEGTPVDARVSMVKPAKETGRKAQLQISAEWIRLADGRHIPLTGGYGKQGGGKKGGKRAVLDPGTLFDAYTDQAIEIAVEGTRKTPVLDLAALGSRPMDVEVLYQEWDGDLEAKTLPVKIVVCDDLPSTPILIDRVNGFPIDRPLRIDVEDFETRGGCYAARGTVEIKPLMKLFRKGINRFQVSFSQGSGRIGTEVILDVQI
jgi:hypothetical protein